MSDEKFILEGSAITESDREYNVSDPKWAHPLMREGWESANQLGAFDSLYASDIVLEEKKRILAEQDIVNYYPNSDSKDFERNSYDVPGCPEEPETGTKVLVYKPASLVGKTNVRTLFMIAGGGMIYCAPEACGLDYYAGKYNCIVVSPMYRTSLMAPYPAAMNDLHASYQWMHEHAEELGIDADNVVLQGGSSGGHLALSLGFRLKRYGFNPKGIVVTQPITDDREIYPSSQITVGTYDARKNHTAYRMYLGYNYGSNLVGPEALANHAAIEDCIGYPPCSISTSEFDADRDYNREFVGKLYAAKTFVNYHSWGGTGHVSYMCAPELAEVYSAAVDFDTEMFWNYDLRRPWVVDEYREKLVEKFHIKE